MDKLILACIEILELKRPVDIRFVSRIRNKNWCAYHYAEIKNEKVIKHVIKYSLETSRDTDRDMQTIIAHEMVHAWQAEYYPHSATHGVRFRDKAFDLRDNLLNEGFDIHDDIYCAETDK